MSGRFGKQGLTWKSARAIATLRGRSGISSNLLSRMNGILVKKVNKTATAFDLAPSRNGNRGAVGSRRYRGVAVPVADGLERERGLAR